MIKTLREVETERNKISRYIIMGFLLDVPHYTELRIYDNLGDDAKLSRITLHLN